MLCKAIAAGRDVAEMMSMSVKRHHFRAVLGILCFIHGKHDDNEFLYLSAFMQCEVLQNVRYINTLTFTLPTSNSSVQTTNTSAYWN